MKELSIEEKAKRYYEVINRMKHYVIDEYGCSRIKVADVFHELKESEDENWLKSLKDKYTWKPSEEQMNTLEYYMHTLVCNEHKEVLFGLYEDLKKLREE